tara:strand:+ start:1623 stop:1745 length:123 start_codon:yes stop_codon:yes gene_type:complete
MVIDYFQFKKNLAMVYLILYHKNTQHGKKPHAIVDILAIT